MRRISVLVYGVGALLCIPLTAAVAQDGPATGAVIWARIPGSSLGGNLASSSGSGVAVPQFVVGYQGGGWSLGLAFGVNKISETDTDSGGEFKTSGTIWQAGPSALINFWQAPDRMTRSNVALELTYGKVSVTDKFTPSGGTTTEQKFIGNLLGVRLGVGGDHFFGQHFGLGLEAGLEGTWLSDLKEDFVSDPPTQDLSAIGAYGVLRTTFAF